MRKRVFNKSIQSCILIFLICSLARIIEYFVIKTDKTILAENFLHKVFGIIVLAVILRLTQLSWDDIGFMKEGTVQNLTKGFVMATACFSVAYLVECLFLYSMNGNVALAVYISGFSLNGEAIRQKGIWYILLCILFNIINVWMEEGIFRGLFTKFLTHKMNPRSMMLLIAFLFGIWHWVMPLRDFMEGHTSVANLLVMGIGYIILAGIMSIKWSILYSLTGSLWMGLGDHLFNNVIVTNLLHVVSNTETDSLQIVRILIGQMISFAIAMVYFRKSHTSK